MTHCFPCSGSGWYVSSSYVMPDAPTEEYPSLTGPFDTSDEARSYVDDLIVSASSSPIYTFINVFEHKTTREQDAWGFFRCLTNDGPNDFVADVFLDLASDPTGSTIVTLASESYTLRSQMLTADPCDCSAIQLLHQQSIDKMQDAVNLMETLFGPE